jgi:hypothetical protein
VGTRGATSGGPVRNNPQTTIGRRHEAHGLAGAVARRDLGGPATVVQQFGMGPIEEVPVFLFLGVRKLILRNM